MFEVHKSTKYFNFLDGLNLSFSQTFLLMLNSSPHLIFSFANINKYTSNKQI